MNKDQIKETIENAVRESGVNIEGHALDYIIDFALLLGSVPKAVEVTVECDGAHDPANLGVIGPGTCPTKQRYTQYIGTKIIHAEPAYRYWMENGEKVIVAHDEDKPQCIKDATACEDGYKVVYAPDGYESWSPKDVFEEAYRPTDGMNFGLALEAAKKGAKIVRRGWNGNGMYVFLAEVIEFHTDADLSEFEDQDVEVGDVLVMRTAKGTFQPGWLASQTDMLADDWYIVDEE